MQETERATADAAAEPRRSPHAQRPDTRATEGFSSAAGAEEAWRTRLQRRQRDMGAEERRKLAATTMQTRVRSHLAKKLFGRRAMIIALLKARLLRWVKRVRRRKAREVAAAEQRARDAQRAAANTVVARLTRKATPGGDEPPAARTGSASYRQKGVGGAGASSRARPSSPQRATTPAPAQPRSRSSQRDVSTTQRSQRSSAPQDGAGGGGAGSGGRAAPLDEAAARELSASRRRQVKDILGAESAESWWADRSHIVMVYPD